MLSKSKEPVLSIGFRFAWKL